MVLAFSFRRSTKRIMAEGSVDALFCLNGVRVLSISWIVLGTVYMILYLNPDVVGTWCDYSLKMTTLFTLFLSCPPQQRYFDYLFR